MTKAEFIAALRHFVDTRGADTSDGYGRIGFKMPRGLLSLMIGLRKYFESPTIPKEEPGINWLYDLHSHIIEAFTEFRTDSKKWALVQMAYFHETSEVIPDLVNVHVDGLRRGPMCDTIARLMGILTQSPWVQTNLEQHFGAQNACIDQAWKRFVRLGYRKIAPRMVKDGIIGLRGDFGGTKLLVYYFAGRIAFTFSRDDTTQVTYVGSDKDMFGFRAGSNIPNISYIQCVEMINEVCDKWDADKLIEDDCIGMG